MLSNETSIKLYQAITDADEERVYEHWHASSIAECPRAHYFKRKGIKRLTVPTAAKMIRWNAGHLLEESIRPHIAKLYPDVVCNQRMTSEKLQLTGEFDNYSKPEKRLIEIKSVHDFAFIERDGVTTLKLAVGTYTNRYGKESKKYEPMLTPYLHHELQNHCYALLFRELDEEVKHIDYVYISLSGRIVVYKTDVRQDMVDKIEERLKHLNEHWEANTLPPCICKPDNPLYDSVLQWCDFKTEDGCCSEELMKGVK